jgi:hypothetical protein
MVCNYSLFDFLSDNKLKLGQHLTNDISTMLHPILNRPVGEKKDFKMFKDKFETLPFW